MSIAFIYISEESSWSLNISSFSSASTAALRSIKKHQAIEMAFTLFPPLGAKVKNIITVPLPWVHPLLDGKDGSKKLGKNFKDMNVIKGMKGLYFPHHLLERVCVVHTPPQTNTPSPPPLSLKNKCILSKN